MSDPGVSDPGAAIAGVPGVSGASQITGVLVTRPEPAASATAARLRAMGLTPVVAPVLRTIVLPATLPAALPAAQLAAAPARRPQAVLCASANAIAALPAGFSRACPSPVLAVGDATARMARAAGFSTVHSASADAQALAALATRLLRPKDGPLLLVTARGRGASLAADLRSRGFRVVRRAVYAAVPLPVLPEAAGAALRTGQLRAALFFSGETGRAFAEQVARAGLVDRLAPVIALTIGRAAAVALERLPWRRIAVAAHPDQDALLALLR